MRWREAVATSYGRAYAEFGNYDHEQHHMCWLPLHDVRSPMHSIAVTLGANPGYWRPCSLTRAQATAEAR